MAVNKPNTQLKGKLMGKPAWTKRGIRPMANHGRKEEQEEI